MRCRPFAGPRSGWRNWWRTRSTTCIACRKTRRICGEWRLLRRRFSADSGFLVTGLPGHCAPGFGKSLLGFVNLDVCSLHGCVHRP